MIKAEPGMVLAQAVNRPDGLVLVGEGLVLSDAIIERIHAAGVSTIWVEGNPLGAEGDVGNLRVVAEKLPHMFRRLKDNVFMMTLCNVFIRHFARKMAEQQALEDAAIERGKGEDSGEGEFAVAQGGSGREE
ncbi:hypothetical protein LJC26_02000 [Desulfovibrio sp. OttesenSCG-928-O18]|nr:hypothetical protein [Desulfovibrio sp. OttesenSCG-928-O18]